MPTSAQTLPRLTMTAQAFENFAEQPENADKLLELIGGEVVEVPINGYASMIAVRCVGAVARFADAVSGGYVTGEAGGYQIGKDRYIPNGAFVAYARQQAPARHGYNPIASDLAVEIDFPSTYQSQEQLRIKIANYLAAGTTVWVVYPHLQRIEVYAPGQPVKILNSGDVLEGDPVLPGFRLALREVFPAE